MCGQHRSDVPTPLQGCTVRSTWMTATPLSTPSPAAPSALTTAPVWTRWAATAAPACPALWASAARVTSTSVSLTPVTPAAPRTACSASTTSTASAAQATLVSAAGLAGGHWVRAGRASHPLSSPGRRCESVINGCKGKPCKNGGTCAVASNTARGFICKCPAVGAAAGLGVGGLPGLKVAAEPRLHRGPGPVHICRKTSLSSGW